MQLRSLLYWLLNSDKQPQYLNQSRNIETGTGVQKTDGSPAHLTSSPDGWNDTLVEWARNNKYLGLFRDFTVPMKFVNDGAKMLRWIKWNIGIEAIYYLSISKLNRTVFPDQYDQWYTGELDFSKFKQTNTGVEIQIVEGGLSKLLKAYESTIFEVPIHTDPNRFTLYLDGLTFENRVDSVIYDQDILSENIVGGAEYWAAGIGITSNEGTTQGIVSNDQNLSPNQPGTSDNVFFKSFSKTTVVHVSGTATALRDEDLGEGTFWLTIRKSNSTTGATLIDYDIIPVQVMVTNQFISVPTYSFDIPVEPNTTLTLLAIAHNTSIGGIVVHINGTLNYNYLVRFDPTLCECMSWMNLFQKLTMKLTNGKYGAKSDFLNTLEGTQCVTSGQAIRQYGSESVIKTTMADFFQACKRWGVGLAIENDQLVIEPYAYFFRNNISFALGEVKDIDIHDAEDLMYNTIKVGYPNQTYDNVNGKDEFNVTQQYTTPITRIVKELDLVCPYRADMFGIELTRLRLFQKDTTDNAADNDTFIMNVVKGSTYDVYRGPFSTKIQDGHNYIVVPVSDAGYSVGEQLTFSEGTFTIESIITIIAGFLYLQVTETVTDGANYVEALSTFDANVYHLNRPAFTAITGLIQPAEAFNVLLSPKDALERNYPYIASIMDMQDAGLIKFQSGEKNSKMSFTLAGKTVTQDADIRIIDLGDKLFKPYYVSFKTKVPINLPETMRTNPYDKISFDYRSTTYPAFIWDARVAPATNDAQEWALLFAPENNMKKLI